MTCMRPVAVCINGATQPFATTSSHPQGVFVGSKTDAQKALTSAGLDKYVSRLEEKSSLYQANLDEVRGVEHPVAREVYLVTTSS